MRTNICVNDVLVNADGDSWRVLERSFDNEGTATAYLCIGGRSGGYFTIFPKYLYAYRVICQHDGTSHGWGH